MSSVHHCGHNLTTTELMESQRFGNYKSWVKSAENISKKSKAEDISSFEEWREKEDKRQLMQKA